MLRRRYSLIRWRLGRRPRSESEALLFIRAHYFALGIPIGHLTDDELRERIVTMGRAMARAGITTRQAMENLSRLGQAFDTLETVAGRARSQAPAPTRQP